MGKFLTNYSKSIRRIFGDYNPSILSFIHDKLKKLGYTPKPITIKGRELTSYENLEHFFSSNIINGIASQYKKEKNNNKKQDKKNIISKNNINRQQEDDIVWKHNSYKHTMDDANDELMNKYQFEGKRTIKINETQYRRLFENIEDEGFKTNKYGEFMFDPNIDRKADTRIFNDNSNELNVRKVLLPKSKIMSFNLYQINNMDVNRALKHKEKMDGTSISWYDDNTNYTNTIQHFIKRSCLYIKRIIGNNPVDYITYPQSSSNFNSLMTTTLLNMYPNSEGIKLIPQMLVKNVRGIFVNTEVAKEIGLSNDEIHQLMHRVEKWKKDEDIRDLRREIEVLKKEVAETLKNRGRGRPSKEFLNKQQLIYLNKQKISALRGKGRDSTVDDNGNIKDFQIKSLDDRTRRAIEGLFTINPNYLSLQTKLRGKTIILFDDNISSGATMDDLCLLLQRYGVANIIPITLGTISPTIYKMSDRRNKHIGEA